MKTLCALIWDSHATTEGQVPLVATKPFSLAACNAVAACATSKALHYDIAYINKIYYIRMGIAIIIRT